MVELITKHTLLIFVVMFWLALPVMIYYIGDFASQNNLSQPNYISGSTGNVLNISDYATGISIFSFVDIFVIGIQNVPFIITSLVITPMGIFTVWLVAVFIRGD